uniref:Uncharacterized protein n=1 Tax=Setaria digitata TaxID=48799 RepID=A0A915PT10_9BILA
MNLFRNADIGHGVMIRNSIGNGVITNLKKECTADYQVPFVIINFLLFYSCSVYEVCAESSISGKRRCTYNPTATYRQCRFNADCQSSQRCEKVLQNLHICRMTKLPTYMQPCTNDYECSAEQRCTDIGSDNSFQRYSRRCLTVDDEPPCISDGDCADTTKICRTSGKIKQCLPVIMNADFAL